MEIKRISISDHHLVVDLFDKYRIFYKQLPDKELAEKFVRERLENNESVIFVALRLQNNETLSAGFTQLYPKYSSVGATKNWVLNDLYVDLSFRRQGIGKKLIRAAMEFARENNAKYVQLETAKDNYSTQKLYESLGFKKQEPDINFFVFRKHISSSRG